MSKNFKKNNVLKYSYRMRYYIYHPLKFIRETIQNFRAAYRRVVYGWCYLDCWNLGYHLLDILPDMLIVLSTGRGYPGNDRFPTPESWSDHLHSIANLLLNAREEVRDEKNEYWQEYSAKLEAGVERDEIWQKYFKRDQELAEEQDIMIEEALKLLAETPLKALWD